jgi:hypothetical protein
MTEELAFDDGFAQRGAIESEEAERGAPRMPVHPVRRHLFAGTGLAEEKDGKRRRRDLTQGGKHLPHRGVENDRTISLLRPAHTVMTGGDQDCRSSSIDRTFCHDSTMPVFYSRRPKVTPRSPSLRAALKISGHPSSSSPNRRI